MFGVSYDEYYWVTTENSPIDIINGIKRAIEDVQNFLSNLDSVIPASVQAIIITLLGLLLGFVAIKVMLSIMKAVFSF